MNVARVVLRPFGTPLPLGFLALAAATAVFSVVQLDWVPADQGRVAAWTALLFTVPLQLLAAVLGFLARDPVAGTGMGVLAGTWAVAGFTTATSPPGASSAALGVLLIVAAVALLVPAAAAMSKIVPAAVIATSAIRFATTGIAELTGAQGWYVAAGVVGLALAVLAVYAALALELEDAEGRTVLPVLRSGQGRSALSGDIEDELADVTHEAGVRKQL